MVKRRNSVTDTDRGLRRIRAELAELGRLSVDVGIQADAGADNEGNPIVVRAVANEFGTRRIPARSFVRAAFDENVGALNTLKQRLTNGVIDGKLTPARAAGLLGQTHEAQVRQKITDLKEPPNAPATVEAKGSSNPLIDTGQMRQSVRYVVR